MESFESEATLKELINYCKTLEQEYKNRTDKMKHLFSQLHINHESSQKLTELVSQLCKVQEEYKLKELNETSLLLAHAEESKTSNDTKCLLKQQEIHLKAYLRLEKILINLLETIGRETTDESIVLSTDETIGSKIAKIKMYKGELDKLNKNSQLMSNFNLVNIYQEIKKLEELRNENSALKQKLSCYGGLKPDLEEAAKQLAQIKLEHDKLTADGSTD